MVRFDVDTASIGAMMESLKTEHDAAVIASFHKVRDHSHRE